jgi:hypothetical protein
MATKVPAPRIHGALSKRASASAGDFDRAIIQQMPATVVSTLTCRFLSWSVVGEKLIPPPLERNKLSVVVNPPFPAPLPTHHPLVF